MLMTNCLLCFSYILILVLFVIILSIFASCDSDWHLIGKSCYYVSDNSSDCLKARALCKTKGSDLIVISDAFEQVIPISDTKGLGRFWIGLTDMNDEGMWEWVDGTSYTTSFKFWRVGEPNDACAHLWKNGEWNDLRCNIDNCNAICEKKL
ncbi:hypothetical protein XELAEV_18018978mg [Xenopus laevis]|uniref:C-type lectin domain-containing protein n=1 Tax=Xenopus laevis TaxID=8355 RepID=A0A974DGB9_XENLA|nr:hypothetical protein XELAEV_18018978mg [Xenopus laevis]